ncbi:MAG: beta-N-acetylhexosaminidase [Candidatus Thorarchaeota archaeon]
MIPLPVDIQYKEGEFHLNSNTCICSKSNLKKMVKYFQGLIKESIGYDLKEEDNINKSNSINFILDDSLRNLKDEGYILEVFKETISIKALAIKGIFYGIQTLRQLLHVELTKKKNSEENIQIIPCVRIEDYPRFKWRGFMLDVSRHFHDVDTIKHILDLLALMKMNVFHWHLTDDQGWRIEIKKYPKLIEIGSKREDTKIKTWWSKKYRGKPHHGFYTQEDVKEVVTYAQDRYITVIPEIEMPGHCRAAIAAYPELSCQKRQKEVAIKPGIFRDIFCIGREETFDFLKNTLNEMIELFPSDIIHIGGDEVPLKRWKNCTDCKRKMKNEKIKKIENLRNYFTQRIVVYLKSQNKNAIGWNEILYDGIDKDVIAQWWLGKKSRILNHIHSGGSIVASHLFHVYLDYNYILIPLQKTYSFEPIPKKLNDKYHKKILGVEAPLWCEWVPDRERLEWQIFPRLVAVAEIGWTLRENKNYKSFIKRLKYFNEKLDALGVNYAPLKDVSPTKPYRILKWKNALKWPEV